MDRAELGKKIGGCAGQGRSLGCDRQILSQVRLPDHEDIGTCLPETAGSGTLFGKQG